MRVVATLFCLTALQAPVHANELDARLARIAHVFDNVTIDLVPRGAPLIRWQRSMRDFVQHAADGLALVAENIAKIPDVSVLSVEPVAHTESSGFGWRDDPIRHRAKFHSGTDFRGKHGTPVLAAGPGVVVFSGRRGGYGNLIEIDHGGGVITRYAHLRRMFAKSDAVVTAGEQIGQVGSSGRSTGPHLHFEVRLENRPVDPITAMTIAELTRESPELGRIAAFVLAPDVQAELASDIDPPKSRRIAKKSTGSRPDRAGRVKRIKPVS